VEKEREERFSGLQLHLSNPVESGKLKSSQFQFIPEAQRTSTYVATVNSAEKELHTFPINVSTVGKKKVKTARRALP